MEHALLSKEMWTLSLAVTVISEKCCFLFFVFFLVPASAQQSGVYAELLSSRVKRWSFKVSPFF